MPGAVELDMEMQVETLTMELKQLRAKLAEAKRQREFQVQKLQNKENTPASRLAQLLSTSSNLSTQCVTIADWGLSRLEPNPEPRASCFVSVFL